MTEPTIVASNGTAVESGGVYLTYSGDPTSPYRVAKVVSVGGGPAGVGWDCQVGSDMTPILSPDLWLKLYVTCHADSPGQPSSDEPFVIMPVSVAMFLAWGPPKFPIRMGTEAITVEELGARVADWHKHAEQNAAADPAA
ncbi:hypothetical protein [Fimbriiglobus ruber]|uniref:hypothetical protein n=1 Tax=Fimbriiglobus ruber TaxID=1908690 RepID=UPI00117B139F|nr:hypothetical protein [Fimbriiglobus ruber]